MKTKEKVVSSGIIVIYKDQILLGHSTGNNFWDLPKGKIESGETPKDAVIREAYEEFNFILNKNRLKYLGNFNYNKYKNLELFLLNIRTKPSVEIFKCNTYFEDKNGNKKPEIDNFGFFSFDEALNKLAYSMKRTLTIIFKREGFI
jgi:8-oxo-dGTP pyrophosphatase MutT (NUDIX family)